MRVVEIFDSIDGEGKYAGNLATFIRLAGCNMNCSYCDTKYANGEDGIRNSKEMSLMDIYKEVTKIGNRHITLTGGEPLIHDTAELLIQTFGVAGLRVNIETNGSIDIERYQYPFTDITMDYKTVSSGQNQKVLIDNLEKLRETDVLKIVCEQSDFEDIRNVLKTHDIKADIYLSPVFGKCDSRALVDFAKELRNTGVVASDKIKVQLQLHKIIWDPEETGV